MYRFTARGVTVLLAAAVLILTGLSTAQAQEGWTDPLPSIAIQDHDSWPTVLGKLQAAKAIVELSEASIIIEVNATDGDAGFQVFVDGDGWRSARVFDPRGFLAFSAFTGSGIRTIGGGTELFLESEEPEYEDLDGFEALIELLPEGEYMFLTSTSEGDFAVGTAELTHDVPAEPEVVSPLPEGEDECAADVLADMAVIEWLPVTTQLTGEPDIEIVGYQVIVENEETETELMVEVPAETTMVTVPPEFLEPGSEYAFEILAIEDSGNQTITESCFETAE